MALNPAKTTQETERRITEQDIGLQIGTVTDEPDVENHRIPVRVHTETTGGATLGSREAAHMLVPTLGDVSLPNQGDTVVLARLNSETVLVLGTIYTQRDSPPTDDGDERHVGADDNAGTFMRGPFGVVPKRSSDPSNPPAGAVWYRTDIDRYRGQQGGTTVTFEITSHSH